MERACLLCPTVMPFVLSLWPLPKGSQGRGPLRVGRGMKVSVGAGDGGSVPLVGCWA